MSTDKQLPDTAPENTESQDSPTVLHLMKRWRNGPNNGSYAVDLCTDLGLDPDMTVAELRERLDASRENDAIAARVKEWQPAVWDEANPIEREMHAYFKTGES